VIRNSYLSTKRISALVEASSVRPLGERRGWIGQIHRRTDVALGYGLRPREAAVVKGMVLGDRSLIPEDLEKSFQRSGVTHVLAISGQHVAILAAVIYFVLRLFAIPTAIRAGITIGLIWPYILIAGAPPSAIRAGVVATFVLAAPLFGRQVSPLHFMSTMLALVLAYNPQLVYNTGFQLSVAAVFGILLFTRPLKSLVGRTLLRPFASPPGQLSNLIAVSLAAQIATSPVVAATFDQVSLVGVLTNLVAVPISGPILILGLLGSLTGNHPHTRRPGILFPPVRRGYDPRSNPAPRRPLLRRLCASDRRGISLYQQGQSPLAGPTSPVDDHMARARRLRQHVGTLL
jgi:competence protein ComEC